MSEVVSNAAPIWHLGRLKERFPRIPTFEIPKYLFSKIVVGRFVDEELRQQNRVPQTALDYLDTLDEPLEVENVALIGELKKRYGVGSGEAETLALYLEHGFDTAILANRGAERMFKEEGANFVEIVQLGEMARDANYIGPEEFREYVASLFELGYKRREYEQLYKSLGLISP